MTKFLLVPMHDNRRDRSWTSGLESRGDTFANPEPLPIGPIKVIGDNVGFVRTD